MERKKETATDMSGGQKKKIGKFLCHIGTYTVVSLLVQVLIMNIYYVLERVEEKLKNNNRDLSMVRTRQAYSCIFIV